MVAEHPAIVMCRTRHGLEPVSAYDAEALDAHPIGTVLLVEVKRQKNPALVGLYWHILGQVWPNTQFPNAQTLHKALLIHTGHVDRTLTIHGHTIDEAMSLKDMTQETFSAYFEAACKVIWDEWQIDVDQFKTRARNLIKDDGL
jgi:hypothetical protein